MLHINAFLVSALKRGSHKLIVHCNYNHFCTGLLHIFHVVTWAKIRFLGILQQLHMLEGSIFIHLTHGYLKIFVPILNILFRDVAASCCYSNQHAKLLLILRCNGLHPIGMNINSSYCLGISGLCPNDVLQADRLLRMDLITQFILCIKALPHR